MTTMTKTDVVTFLKERGISYADFTESYAAMKETDERDTTAEIAAVIGADGLAAIVAAHGGTGCDRRTAKDENRCTVAIIDAVTAKAAAMGIENPFLLKPQESQR